jgi:Na+/H+ antiporter NhaD/arsenite permease-like protein
VLNVLADKGLWAATLGTGFLTAFLSSIMNNMPTVLVGRCLLMAARQPALSKRR